VFYLCAVFSLLVLFAFTSILLYFHATVDYGEIKLYIGLKHNLRT